MPATEITERVTTEDTEVTEVAEFTS